MKIKLLFTTLLSFAAFCVSAQSQGRVRCSTMDHLEWMKTQNPSLAAQMTADENTLQQWLAAHANARTSNSIYTLPVVVHVVYKTNGQNISDAQIQSQIDVLNEDFARLNPDTTDTPVGFRSVASGTNFQFCLARRDQFGNPTTGIERRLTTITSFSDNDNVKHYSSGGLDSWDVNNFLNIWVCNMNGGLLGYGEFPSSTHTNTFGVVIQYDAFGRVGTVSAPYNGGRTCTHEFSHCFRLYHIWGDDGGACSGTDYVADTPNQADATFGCYVYPHNDACNTDPAGIMFMNYMDYSDDNCLNMFTANQASRMFAAINSYYNTLFNSPGCLDIVANIDSPSDFQFSVYPNPTDGIINLDMFAMRDIGSKVNVRVTDMMGKLISENVLDNPYGKVEHIDMKGNADGIYFITLSSGHYNKTVRFSLAQ